MTIINYVVLSPKAEILHMHGLMITSHQFLSHLSSSETSFSEVLGHRVGDEKKLTIWDLHGLLFLLATVANKWRAIGGGLHFPDHTLNVIGQKLVCIVGGSVQCLREMLAQWLGRDKPPECDPPTTCVLAVVLRHPSVNEGQIADTLERTFQPASM